MRHAVINNGVVVNVIDLDAGHDWTPPEGALLAPSDEAEIGWTFDGARFSAPTPAPEPTTLADVKGEAQRRILSKYPAWKQINAALGLYDQTAANSMRTYINAVRLASDTIESRLAADPGLDPAVQPDWPEDI